MNWEVIGGICAVLGVLGGFYTYYNRKTPEYKEAKKYMISQYDFLHKLNSNVLLQWESFADKYDAWDVVVSEGLTFRWGIGKMRTVKDELFKVDSTSLKNTNGSIRDIESFTENLKKQIEYHCGLQTTLELFQNHIDINHPYLNEMANDKDGY